MKAWKKLIAYFAGDFSGIKHDFAPFCLIYAALAFLYAYCVPFVSGSPKPNAREIALLFALIVAYSLAILVNQYRFQAAYSARLGISAKLAGIPGFIGNIVRIYVLQSLIFAGVAIAAFLVPTILGMPFAGKFPALLRIIYAIVAFLLISFGVFWYFRLLFVRYILTYSRDDNTVRSIVRESARLVRENLAIILPVMALLCGFVVARFMAAGQPRKPPSFDGVQTALVIVYGLFMSFASVTLSVHAAKDREAETPRLPEPTGE